MTSSAIAIEDEPPLTALSQPTSGGAMERDGKDRKVLLSNVVWMLIGNVAYGFSQWALVVALAKLGTVEMVGNFALAIAVVLPVLMLSSLSLRALQITDATRSYRFLEYASVRLVMVVLSLIFICAFCWILGYSAMLLTITALIAGAKAFEYTSDIFYGLLQQKEDMAGIAISMVLRAILSVATLSLIVYFSHSLVWAATGLLCCSGVVLFVYDIPKAVADRRGRFAAELRTSFAYLARLGNADKRRRLSKLALTGLPMGFALMMISLNLNIPRYFIERHLGMAELGIFSAIAVLLAAGGIVTNAVGQAAAPRLAIAFAKRDKRTFRLLLTALIGASLGLGVLGFGGALLFGRQALALLYRPEYSTHQDLLVWLMAASGLYYLGSTLGYAVTAVRCFNPQLPLFSLAALTTAAGCIVFVPAIGLRGAALAILISAFVQCVGSGYLLYGSCKRANAEAAA